MVHYIHLSVIFLFDSFASCSLPLPVERQTDREEKSELKIAMHACFMFCTRNMYINAEREKK